MDKDYIIDVHTHPTNRPFRSSDKNKSIWETVEKSSECDNIPKLIYDNMVKETVDLGINKPLDHVSQANFDACSEAGNHGVFVALYPSEKPFYDLRNPIDIVISEKMKGSIGACMTGFDHALIKKMLKTTILKNGPVDYFQELLDEYNYLVDQQSVTSSNKKLKVKKFEIASDFEHYKEILSENKMAAVLTIEGGHSIFTFDKYRRMKIPAYRLKKGKPYYDKYLGQAKKAIKKLKKQKSDDYKNHSPFFITLAHHFWNLICGHARSFDGMTGKLGVNQEFGLNSGFTELGVEVLHLLLNKTKTERRILIDTKHMSIRTRREFYEIWEQYNNQGDGFPIICSHAAVVGDEDEYAEGFENDKGKENNGKYFNVWSINLTNEDISYIAKSDGIIGLLLHEKRVPGDVPADRFKELKEDINLAIEQGEVEEEKERMEELAHEYVMLVVANMLHVVKTVGSRKGWDIITLGTDFDGLINAMDVFPTIKSMPDLFSRVENFLDNPDRIEGTPFDEDYIQFLKFNLTGKEIVQKMKYQNAERFMQKYFNDEFLLKNDGPSNIYL